MNPIRQNKPSVIQLATGIALFALMPAAQAVSVPLQNATATFSQTFSGDFSVARAINGTYAENLGWSVFDKPSETAAAQTAVFETTADIGFGGGSLLSFNLYQTHGIDFGMHTLGRFRLSITTDDRSLFADGLASGGDVSANWTVLDANSFISANGATLSKLGDLSILASGTSPDQDIYTITALTTLTGITGIRLEVLEDASLPANGPGRQPLNGNFELSEFTVNITAVPEPGPLALLTAFGLIWRVARNRK